MASKAEVVDIYRRDAKSNHTLLSKGERRKLVEVSIFRNRHGSNSENGILTSCSLSAIPALSPFEITSSKHCSSEATNH